MLDWILRGEVLRASAAYLALWFVLNGVVAFTVLGAGFGDEFPVKGNWEHGVLHMATGLVGAWVVVRMCDGAVRNYLLAIAVVYSAAAVSGAVDGHEALGFATVDTFGTVVHGLEAALVAAILVLAPRPGPARRRPAAG